jgi:tetratricopeptide (TPR) repeat protein
MVTGACKLGFDEGTGTHKLYLAERKAGAKCEDIDQGYDQTDYFLQERKHVGAGDGILQKEEVRGYAIERHARFQLSLKQDEGIEVAWSLEGLDPEILRFIDQALKSFKRDLIRAGYKKGTDDYADLLGLSIFALVMMPQAQKGEKTEVPPEIRAELEDRRMGKTIAFLEKNGGFGLIESGVVCIIQPNARQVLEERCGSGGDKSLVLYAVLKRAGLKAAIAYGKPKEKKSFAFYTDVGIMLSDRVRIFDPAGGETKAELLYQIKTVWWTLEGEINYLSDYYYNLGSDLNGENDDEAAKKYRIAVEWFPGNAYALSNLGVYYLRNDQIEEAEKELVKAFELAPDEADICQNLGEIYLNKGNYTRAIRLFRAALKLGPDEAKVHFYLGLSYANSGKLDKAIEEYEMYKKLRPKDAFIYSNLSAIYLYRKEIAQAKEEARLALEMDPNFPGAHNNLGLAYFKAGEFDLAIKEIEEAMLFDRNNSGYPVNLGRIYLDKGELEKAIKYFEHALVIDSENNQARLHLKIAKIKREITDAPSEAALYMGLGDIYLGSDRLNEAQEAYRKATELDPHRSYHFNQLALTYHRMDEWDRAIENYKKAIELRPGNTVAHYNLAHVYRVKGDLDQAERELKAAIDLDDKDADLFNALGDVYMEKGAWGKAAVAFWTAGGLDKDIRHINEKASIAQIRDDLEKEEGSKARFHGMMGMFYLEMEEWDRAATEYKEALKIDPDLAEARTGLRKTSLLKAADAQSEDAGLYYELGKVYIEENNYGKAREALQKAKELDPLSKVIRVEYRLAQIRQALKKNPNDAALHNELGLIHMKKKDVNSAIAEYRKAIELDPLYAEPHNHLALAYLYQTGEAETKAEEVMGEFSKAAALNPRYADPLYHQGRCLIETGKGLISTGQIAAGWEKYREAQAHFARVLKIDEKHLEARDALRAIKEIQKSIKKSYPQMNLQ